MPQLVVDVIVVVAFVILIVILRFARTKVRRAAYTKMNQPGKQKSAIQKWFGW